MGLTSVLSAVAATDDERHRPLSGDDLVAHPDVVMDRAFTVPGVPEVLWPWILQLGKRRAGWYLPRRVEAVIPLRRRAVRSIAGRWQHLAPGDVVPDYGGSHATFDVVTVRPPHTLVYRSRRRATELSWAIHLTPTLTSSGVPGTRVHLRLRLGPVRRRWLAEHLGGAFDLVTVAGLAAGLRERVPAVAPPAGDTRRG